jgi:uncharacterized membrane protein YoaK (UPF0700 family)
MHRYRRPEIFLAACLAALGGFIDATGYLSLGGYFVSFMSGNSTRLAVGLARHAPEAGVAGALILSFVVGGALGFLAGHFAARWQRPAVLLLVSALLAISAAMASFGDPLPALMVAAIAMGAENASFQDRGEVVIGLTYVSGALVKLGQKIGAALVGGKPLAWLPYLLLWVSLAAGALAGASLYPLLGLNALWLGAVAAGGLAVISAVIGADGASGLPSP